MKIKVIATGSTKEERAALRWGVSFLVGEDVLFDTFGDAGVFTENLRRFSVDTKKIKHIVISHDDWDHITGLWGVIDKCANPAVYICPGFGKDIKERIASLGVRIVEAAGPQQVCGSVFTTGQIEGGSGATAVYEQSLAIKTPRGLAVITGCAHPGITNILARAADAFGDKPYMAAGGFHLKDHPEPLIRQVIADMKAIGVEKVVPMHCTGAKAVELFKKEFGHGCIDAKEGSVIEV